MKKSTISFCVVLAILITIVSTVLIFSTAMTSLLISTIICINSEYIPIIVDSEYYDCMMPLTISIYLILIIGAIIASVAILVALILNHMMEVYGSGVYTKIENIFYDKETENLINDNELL